MDGFNWWNRTITHYKRVIGDSDETLFERYIYDNCSFVSKADKRIVGNDSKIVKVCVVRIPGIVEIYNGDIIVLGDVSFEIDEYIKGKRSSDILSQYVNSFSVNYVGYNDNIEPIHTRVQGDSIV